MTGVRPGRWNLSRTQWEARRASPPASGAGAGWKQGCGQRVGALFMAYI